jgi:hypothetical protein
MKININEEYSQEDINHCIIVGQKGTNEDIFEVAYNLGWKHAMQKMQKQAQSFVN